MNSNCFKSCFPNSKLSFANADENLISLRSSPLLSCLPDILSSTSAVIVGTVFLGERLHHLLAINNKKCSTDWLWQYQEVATTVNPCSTMRAASHQMQWSCMDSSTVPPNRQGTILCLLCAWFTPLCCRWCVGMMRCFLFFFTSHHTFFSAAQGNLLPCTVLLSIELY